MYKIDIRKAERQDVPLLLEFIKGIARYEKLENEVIASTDVLEREMFDEHRAEAVFAVVNGREVGFALYFYNFSTLDIQGCIWKICSYGRKSVAKATERHCCCICSRLHGSNIAEGWNGRV